MSVRELAEACRRRVQDVRADDAETRVLLDVMMYAQLHGNNQGIIKVTTKGIARDPRASVEKEHEAMLSANLSGEAARPLVLHQAMEIAAEKAEAHGFMICGTNNTSTSTGALGITPRPARSGALSAPFAVFPDSSRPTAPSNPSSARTYRRRLPPQAVVLDMAPPRIRSSGAERATGEKIRDVAIDGEGNVTEIPTRRRRGAARRSTADTRAPTWP